MLIESIDDQSPLAVARRLPQGLGFVCLSGSPTHVVDRCLQTDRYSFIGIDPWAHLHSKKGQTWYNGTLETRCIEAILSHCTDLGLCSRFSGYGGFMDARCLADSILGGVVVLAHP